MTEDEWEEAERREPGREYVEPDYSYAKRQERRAYWIFILGSLAIVAFLFLAFPASPANASCCCCSGPTESGAGTRHSGADGRAPRKESGRGGGSDTWGPHNNPFGGQNVTGFGGIGAHLADKAK